MLSYLSSCSMHTLRTSTKSAVSYAKPTDYCLYCNTFPVLFQFKMHQLLLVAVCTISLTGPTHQLTYKMTDRLHQILKYLLDQILKYTYESSLLPPFSAMNAHISRQPSSIAQSLPNCANCSRASVLSWNEPSSYKAHHNLQIVYTKYIFTQIHTIHTCDCTMILLVWKSQIILLHILL